LFANSDSSQRIVSIFLHPISKRGTISIGDISLKNARGKLSEVSWVSLQDNTNDGVCCFSTGMSLWDSFNRSSHEVVLNSAKDVYFTTSSSFVYLPEDCLSWLTATLKDKTDASCWILPHNGVYRCEWADLEDKRKAVLLTLTIKLMQKTKISIPITTLILLSDALFI
jgi:hypothetical protein